jgi:hypothetical protein
MQVHIRPRRVSPEQKSIKGGIGDGFRLFTSDVRDDPVRHGQTDDGEDVRRHEERPRDQGKFVHVGAGTFRLVFVFCGLINCCDQLSSVVTGHVPQE